MLSSNRLSYFGCDIQHRLNACEVHCKEAQFWHILGANGSGKSTLLSALSGLMPCKKLSYNQINVEQLSLVQQAQIRSLLSQHHSSQFEVPSKQLLSFFTQFDCLPNEIDICLQINALLHKPLNTLSGGQQQRFHIARCVLQIWQSLKQGQGVLILDEPLQGLDIKHQFQVLDMLKLFCQRGNTVIMSCHDVNMSLKYATHGVLLANGNAIQIGTADQCLTSEHLTKVFDVDFSDVNGKPMVDNLQ